MIVFRKFSNKKQTLALSLLLEKNGILKGEYLECYDIETFEEAEKLLHSVIKLYNEERPHMSIGNLTPSKVHDNNIITRKIWKNYWKKREEIFVE